MARGARNSRSPHATAKNSPLPPSSPTLQLLCLSPSFSVSVFAFSAFSLLTFFCNFHSPSNRSETLLISPSPSSSSFLFNPFPTLFKLDDEPSLSRSSMGPLPPRIVILRKGNSTEEEEEFWKQPYGENYRPCLDFSLRYRKESARIANQRRKFVLVFVSGGLTQQRNQIVDAVVIARILGAALVVPILRTNLIWQDESKFSDIFDLDHFNKTLQADVRIVLTLPSTHSISKNSADMPHDVSPFWIRTRLLNRLNEGGVIALKGLDSKLSKNLPPDLQKLRCKVAFHAIKFAAAIEEVGNRLARRMWIDGPYIALHLRLERDVWVRTGCQTGLGPEYDDVITKIRESQPELLTGRLLMSYNERRLVGFCPLNAFETARLLEGLGAPRNARIYVAGGEPFGGADALRPLITRFPNVISKETLEWRQELAPFINKSSALAAIDYIVSLSSDIFMPSHGGNMGRALQGHRAYEGHRKYIKPHKQFLALLFRNGSIDAAEFGMIVRKLHSDSQGQPEPRNNKRDRDVLAYPVPECMCKGHKSHFLTI